MELAEVEAEKQRQKQLKKDIRAQQAFDKEALRREQEQIAAAEQTAKLESELKLKEA